MLLQRLRDHAALLDDAGPSMYKRTPMRYEVQLDVSGKPLGPGIVTLTGGEGKKDRGLPLLVPSRVRGGTAPKPILLADTAEYALGWGRPGKAAAYHDAFIKLVRECADDTDEPDVRAVAAYLARSPAERLEQPVDFDTSANVIFSVAGRRPVDLPSVQSFWARYADRSGAAAAAADGSAPLPATQCMVCGQRRPVVPRLPYLIKGLGPVGGLAAGTALVSANSNAFSSYGLAENFIAPMCGPCAEAVCKALNVLIADERSRLYIGSALYVFWTRAPTANVWMTLLSQPTADEVAALLASAWKGSRGAIELDANAFYCVALTGNRGRIAVRDWIDTTIGAARGNLARYFALQRLVSERGDPPRYFGVYRLMAATQREGSKQPPPPRIPRAFIRLALAGGALPEELLAQVIRRVRADRAITYAQAVLIKMTLASRRPATDGEDDWMSSLDTTNRDPAYLCGRLLAVLDAVQRAALGERNATIVDRFFGAASTAPISVFGRLVRGAQPHLAKLRRDRPGTYHALEGRMEEILSCLGTFPRTLTLREQGLFALGYYHQRAADARARIERREARDADAANAAAATTEPAA